jgi:MFS family permease
VGEIGDLVGET